MLSAEVPGDDGDPVDSSGALVRRTESTCYRHRHRYRLVFLPAAATAAATAAAVAIVVVLIAFVAFVAGCDQKQEGKEEVDLDDVDNAIKEFEQP